MVLTNFVFWYVEVAWEAGGESEEERGGKRRERRYHVGML
jgi:hypothetical protein